MPSFKQNLAFTTFGKRVITASTSAGAAVGAVGPRRGPCRSCRTPCGTRRLRSWGCTCRLVLWRWTSGCPKPPLEDPLSAVSNPIVARLSRALKAFDSDLFRCGPTKTKTKAKPSLAQPNSPYAPCRVQRTKMCLRSQFTWLKNTARRSPEI